MNEYTDKNVFVSGGAGVIGIALVRLLSHLGAKLFVGDLKPRPKGLSSDILYREGDLNTISKKDILAFNPEYFFHLAATFERSEETYDFWQENYHHNVQLSHYLIDCLKEAGSLRRVVFASSYLIYNPDLYFSKNPKKRAVKLTEESPVHPRNLCGMAKLLHEQELRFIEQFSGGRLSALSARIFRSFGKNSRDIISRWIRSLLKNEPITVYAQEGIFDFIFAEDVAEGLLRLGLSQATGVVNLGRGEGRSISDVLSVLNHHFPTMRLSYETHHLPYEASEANMDRFRSITGWQPFHRIEDAIPLIIQYETETRKELS